MLKLRILAVGDSKEKWLRTFMSDYESKLKHFCKLEIIYISPFKEAREQLGLKIDKETETILGKLDPTDEVYLCDLQGRSLTSKAFAGKFEDLLRHSSGRRMVFIIGGAYGVGDKLRDRAKTLLKLSDMTMNHHVAMAFLLEQIYRAFTIVQGLPYHNE